MAELSFVAHLPLLRIASEQINCGDFSLWRMPFTFFNDLTQGAFSDHQARYDATQPVFLRVDMTFDAGDGLVRKVRAPGPAVMELKISTANWTSLTPMGLHSILALHDGVIDRFSSALALAVPASVLPPSRWSVTFAQVDEEHSFVFGDRPYGTVRVQGDADVEYLFENSCAGDALDDAAIQRAGQWLGLVDFAMQHEALAAALRVLRASAAPSLTEDDQSLLCSVALEALLQPEVRSGLGEVFATRSSHLPGAEDVAALRSAAAILYDARSAGLHGAAQAPDATVPVHALYAAQLLAAAVVGLAHGLRAGGTLDQLRAELADGPMEAFGAPAWRLSDSPTGLRSSFRISPLVRQRSFLTRVTSAGIHGVDGVYGCYAPLTGLACLAPQPLGEPPCPGFMPLSGSEVVSLEDRDIARDYLSELHMVPERIASLALFLREEDVNSDDQAALRVLRRQRDLAVASLRLAGFDGFIDPELAGLHVYHEKRPLREPSVLRQTVLTRLRNEADATVTDADRERTAPMWALLHRYSRSATHPDIERWLSAFRRLHDRDFIPPVARANLGFALLEALLGRFRAPDDPVPLELLVSVVVGAADPAVVWFTQEGRTWRNALAHGRLRQIEDEAPIQHLLVIARAALPRAIALWLDKGDPKARPAKLLIRTLSSDLSDRGSAS